jgi:acyl-CoA reductase-like NAD-dependent aldehyde dehydrogenase
VQRSATEILAQQGGFTLPRKDRIKDDVTPEMFVGREEIFGPVVSVMRAPNLDAAITLTNRSRYGNTASLFTQSGAAARTFRERIQAGMLGINLGVPALMCSFRSAAGRVRCTVISMRRVLTPLLSTRERK